MRLSSLECNRALEDRNAIETWKIIKLYRLGMPECNRDSECRKAIEIRYIGVSERAGILTVVPIDIQRRKAERTRGSVKPCEMGLHVLKKH